MRDNKLDVKIKEDQKKFEQVECDDTPPNMSDDEDDADAAGQAPPAQ